MAKENMKKCCPSLRRVFFLTTTDSKCWCAIMRSEKTHTHTLACNEFFGMQWITDAAARSDAMNTPATNSSACNELRMRQRDRAQWMTAADTPSCGQKRHTRWPATNSSACNESRMRQRIVCNALRLLIRHRAVRKDTHTLACNEFQVLMCHHAVRKDTHDDVPPLPAGDVTSYRQRRANGC